MNDFIEPRDEDQFANSESCRDLRVSPDLRQPGVHLTEAINSIFDDPNSLPGVAPRESIEVRVLVFWPADQ